MRCVIWILVLLVCAANGVSAETAYSPVLGDPLRESYRWTTFPEMRDKGITCVAQDSSGNLWLGTEHGVWRYDGLEIEKQADLGAIQTLCVASDGRVFAGGRAGLWVLGSE